MVTVDGIRARLAADLSPFDEPVDLYLYEFYCEACGHVGALRPDDGACPSCFASLDTEEETHGEGRA